MSEMRAFAVELARAGGRIAREHFRHVGVHQVQAKGRRDYVSHVDRLVEDAMVRRIRARFPEHRILGEEGGHQGADADDRDRPVWIIDPIDGTTNFLHGMPWFAISVAYCDRDGPVDGVVLDPIRDEAFIGERGAGLWVDSDRAAASGCTDLSLAVCATGLPFRHPGAIAAAMEVFHAVQVRCDDQRRTGSAALDLAYVACGRCDAYYELGIKPWDVAAGELLVRCGGGVATDLRGNTADLQHRQSALAAATPALHQALAAVTAPLAACLDRPPFQR
jgi:myo-inositol-1(or 4)-monophosphatase